MRRRRSARLFFTARIDVGLINERAGAKRYGQVDVQRRSASVHSEAAAFALGASALR